MINKKENLNFFNKIGVLIRNNFKLIIIILAGIFLFFILYQYYNYYNNNKTLKLSKLYHQAVKNNNINNFEEKLKLIAEDNGTFGVLASLDLISQGIENKDYKYSYNHYLKLLEKKSLKKTYINIVALHGAYNLFDHISNEEVINLLYYVDPSLESFIGHKLEIAYFLAIRNNNNSERIKLSSEILNNKDISKQIKERIRKLDEFEKYK